MNEGSAGRLQWAPTGLRARRGDSVITRLMAEQLAHPEMLSLAAGFTDNAVLPAALVQEACARLAADPSNAWLQYGMNRGRHGLRRAAAELLRGYPGEQELPLDADHVLVTNGSQQALYILVQLFCEPGDIVLVQRPSYFVFLELLQGLGVRALSLPGDAAGQLDRAGLEPFVEELRASGELGRVRLVYLMGAYANPSSGCLSGDDKRALARALRRLDPPVPVLEDMAYRELYFDAPWPARSLLAMEEWRDFPVVYLGTFTKPFATGLKVGFMASRERAIVKAVAKVKGHHDFGTAHFTQAILEHVLETGLYPAHLAGIRAHYRDKCRHLEQALRDHGLGAAGWQWESPLGGLLLWARGPGGTDTRLGSAFHRACLEREILYVPGDLCFAEGAPYHCARLSFGALAADRIAEAARRFCAAAYSAANP